MKKLSSKILRLFLFGLILLIPVSCNLDYDLTDSITADKILNSTDGLEQICNGNLALMKARLQFQGQFNGGNSIYIRQYFYSSEFASDNVVCGHITPDPLFLSFTYEHNPTQLDMGYFWWVSYKIIASANTVITMYEEDRIADLTPARKQMIGENYFIRAFAYFSLLNFYAKQYAIDPQAPGVPLRLTNTEGSQLARSTVGECYDQLLSDLQSAEGLMSKETDRGVAYPSIGAVYAFLSRVYLYMEDNDNAIIYADKVFELGTYEIDDDFAAYFPNAALGRKETIWCLKFLDEDVIQATQGALSSMYNTAGGGWGEEFVSDPLRKLFDDRPWDTRGAYLLDSISAGLYKDGVKVMYMSKFNDQNGIPTLTSPVFFRLSEVLLNRAEAYAKNGEGVKALDELDELNSRRGYTADKLYNGSVPPGSTALDEVLLTRRLELAFEGQRKFDLLRNRQDLNRQYWGYHIPNLVPADIDYNTVPEKNSATFITWDDPRNLFYIPAQETDLNKACVQNE
ncbi:MAG: RagB/SusD family nutrient uptake outer membrane protein [Bacteroidota bacterium]